MQHRNQIRSCPLAVTFTLATMVIIVAGGAPRLVRVSLEKITNEQKGSLGQSQTSYYANIGVGTPVKPFKMLVDVNAREIWLPHFSALGIVYTRLNYRQGYSKKESRTSVKEEEKYTISYQGVELTGKAYSDYFEFENVSESLAPVRYQQRFLAISAASNDKFCKYGVDGVIALNPWPISETGSDLITVGLARANLTGELKFALSLNQDVNSNYGGELVLGGINPTRFLGALMFHQVHSQHSWQVELAGVMLGAKNVACADVKCKALLSTSVNDIYAPARYVLQILRLLGAENVGDYLDESKLYTIDCLRVATAPTLTIVIEGFLYSIPGTSYIRKKVDGMLFKSTTCYVGILSNGSEQDWELGTNFLANFYSVFDVNKRQVAFGAVP